MRCILHKSYILTRPSVCVCVCTYSIEKDKCFFDAGLERVPWTSRVNEHDPSSRNATIIWSTWATRTAQSTTWNLSFDHSIYDSIDHSIDYSIDHSIDYSITLWITLYCDSCEQTLLYDAMIDHWHACTILVNELNSTHVRESGRFRHVTFNYHESMRMMHDVSMRMRRKRKKMRMRMRMRMWVNRWGGGGGCSPLLSRVKRTNVYILEVHGEASHHANARISTEPSRYAFDTIIHMMIISISCSVNPPPREDENELHHDLMYARRCVCGVDRFSCDNTRARRMNVRIRAML